MYPSARYVGNMLKWITDGANGWWYKPLNGAMFKTIDVISERAFSLIIFYK